MPDDAIEISLGTTKRGDASNTRCKSYRREDQLVNWSIIKHFWALSRGGGNTRTNPSVFFEGTLTDEKPAKDEEVASVATKDSLL
ncbi:hypothetical protein G9A89_017535 [Geosiphon pyriformis]|nr:hypothetical protein G9A89_017535 [Geosiphon pyriformis]